MYSIIILVKYMYYILSYLSLSCTVCSFTNAISFSENQKVSHYIISRRHNCYLIGDQSFADLNAVITFYKTHYLDTTTLTEIVSY